MNNGSACRIGLWEGTQLKTVECSLHGSPAAIGKVLMGYDLKEVKGLLYEGDLVLLGESSWSSIYYRRQLSKSRDETLPLLNSGAEELFRQNRHIKHLYLLENSGVWHYYSRRVYWRCYQLQGLLPTEEKHMYRVFMLQNARTCDFRTEQLRAS